MTGILTNMLKKKYIDAGCRLTEDEDFLYLHVPGVSQPIVLSAQVATIEIVESLIDEQLMSLAIGAYRQG
jgi:hypothetical protein